MAQNQPSAFASLGGLVGAAGGFVVVWYGQANLLIPAASMAGLYALFTETRLRPKAFLFAISISGGHVAWFILAGVLSGQVATVALDVVALSAAIIWLWARPALAPAIALGAVQAGSFAINAISSADFAFRSPPHRALFVHCALRLLAIGVLAHEYSLFRRKLDSAATESDQGISQNDE